MGSPIVKINQPGQKGPAIEASTVELQLSGNSGIGNKIAIDIGRCGRL
jgi:hypothetical protein